MAIHLPNTNKRMGIWRRSRLGVLLRYGATAESEYALNFIVTENVPTESDVSTEVIAVRSNRCLQREP
jgi:hypothetical protein